MLGNAVAGRLLSSSQSSSRVVQGHTTIVWLLLQSGFSSADIDECGNNSLHAACAAGNLDVVKAITATGCHPRTVNNFGNDAASLAATAEIKAYMTAVLRQDRCAESGVCEWRAVGPGCD